MLELLIGKDWRANSEALMARIVRDVADKKGNRILLVPELISHDTERRLCEAAGDTVSRYAQVTGFSRLPGMISRYCGEAMPACLDKAGCAVAMASAARQLHGQLKAFASVESKPEFLLQMVDAVSEFKRCCITPQMLDAAVRESSGELAQKVQELSLVLQAYDAVCAQGKRDPSDLLNWALEVMEDSDFAGEHVVYIDGFPDFTRQHMAILEHFIKSCPQVVVSVNCDSLDSDRYAFEKAAQTAKELRNRAIAAGVECVITYVEGRDDELRPLRERLFQGESEIQPGLSRFAHAYTVDTMFQECQAAAEDVQKMIAEGVRYRDIAIACTDMAGYQSALGMILRRMNIPFYQSGTELVSDSFVMNTLFAALEAALSGFEKGAMRRYLRSALSPLDADECDLVENYTFVWNIQGNQWKSAWTMHPVGLGEKWDARNRQLLDRLNQARAKAMGPLIGLQIGFNKATKVSQQVEAIHEFLLKTGFADRMEKLAAELDEQGDNRSAQMVNQMWDILLNALEQLDGTLGQTSWDSEAFLRLFSLLLSQYDVGTIPTVLDAVMVGPVSALRCHQSKHLLVLGCEEGVFPGYAGGSSVLSDAERDELKKLNVTLTGGGMEGISVEFSSVYGLICGASRSVSLYCSGNEPSFVVKRVQKLTGIDQGRQLTQLIGNTDDAAAYLVRKQQVKDAEALGMQEFYEEMQRRGNYGLGSVSSENVKALYGEKLYFSPTKIDEFASCRLKHFLYSGLRLKEQNVAAVDPMQYGNLIHYVLECAVRRVMDEGGFEKISLDQFKVYAREYAVQYIRDNLSELDSQRTQYLLERNLEDISFLLWDLWDELRQSKFRPVAMELAFGEQKDMPGIQIPNKFMEAEMIGKADRVDLFKTEYNDYFRIVDYKTGEKAFELRDIVHGVGLQMLLYLYALKHNKCDLLGTNPTIAGAQYFPAKSKFESIHGSSIVPTHEQGTPRSGMALDDNALLDAMDPRAGRPRFKKNFFPADGAQTDMICRYAMNKVSEFVEQIAAGNVTPNPYCRGSDNTACAYCKFGAICNSGDVTDKRKVYALKFKEFMEKIEEGVGENG